MSNVIRILIADDHPILGQALTMFLQCEPDMTVVGHACDGTDLNIAESTVRFHANNIFGKLNVSNRTY